MKTALSLLIVVGLALIVDQLSRREAAVDVEPMRTAMCVGLLMLGAYLTGRLVERIHLPAITGYLMFGTLVGPWALSLVPAEQILRTQPGVDPPLQFINDLAVSLIALTAGGEIHLSWLKDRARQVFIVLFGHVIILFLAVAAAMYLARSAVPFTVDADRLTALVIAVLAAVVMIAKSPAVTVAMISDYRASGPMSRMTLAITVIKDLMLIIVFATVMAVSKGLLDEKTAISGQFLLAIAVQLTGSIAVGAVVGVAMAWYARRVKAHLLIFIVAGCMLTALVGEQHFYIAGQTAHLEPLVMALSAGLLMNNLWPRTTQPLFAAIESMSMPVYCLFFALAGASINLSRFADLWTWALVLVAIRAAATWAGTRLAIEAAGLRDDWARLLWLGMISQAGVSLVLVTLIADAFADSAWAVSFKSVMIGVIFINQLLGPIGFRYALIRSGEAYQVAPRRLSVARV